MKTIEVDGNKIKVFISLIGKNNNEAMDFPLVKVKEISDELIFFEDDVREHEEIFLDIKIHSRGKWASYEGTILPQGNNMTGFKLNIFKNANEFKRDLLLIKN